MKLSSQKSRKTIRDTCTITFVAFVLSMLLGWMDVTFLGLELKTLDLRFRSRGPIPLVDSPLIIVQVDNRSYKDLNERFPFPREYYAHLLDNLKEAGAAAVLLDIQFTEQVSGNFAGLDSLAKSLSRNSPVILSGELVIDELTGYRRLDYPLNELLATEQPWGLINDIQDFDGVNRLYPLYMSDPSGSGLVPSLGAQLFIMQDDLQIAVHNPDSLISEIRNGRINLGDTPIQLVPGQSNAFRINYYGPPGTFPVYSFSDILDDADFDLSHPDLDTDYMEQWGPDLYELIWGDLPHPFKDKIVLVGVSALDLHDDKRTPFYGYGGSQVPMPGVETHAHAIQTIIDQNWIKPFFVGSSALLPIFLLAFLGAILVNLIGPLPSLFAAVVLICSWIGISLFVFTNSNLWLEIVSPVSATVASWISGVLIHFLQARKERTEIRGMFAQYVPEAVVSDLIADPSKLVLGGEERQMSVMFSDVEGFTTISESLTPTDLVELLNEYLTDMTDCVYEQGGIIDKYEGDAIMAEFGAPIPCEDHAYRACCAAMHMQDRLAKMREAWRKSGQPELKARIGVNSGQMVVGNMGSKQIFDFTVMGDAVNLASRLEGVNKFYASYVMASEDTWLQVADKFLGRKLDLIRVKGKNEPIAVYEIFDFIECDANEIFVERQQRYEAALKLYFAMEFSAAAKSFEQLHVDFPEDGPANMLALRSREYEENPPEDGWDGVMTMTSK
jgi:adenylate cyclase